MVEWVEKLLILQDKDTRIAKLKEQSDSVPAAKAEVDAMLVKAEAAVATAKKALQEEEKDLKNLEMQVDSLQEKKRDFLAKSTMIKNNEEYRAALDQIGQCDRQITGLEDRELELMEAIEEARERLARGSREMEATRQRAKEMHTDLDTRLKNCREQTAKLMQERGPALAEVAKIAKAMATRYERLRRGGGGRLADQRSFVPVRDDVCDRCRMNLTAQTRMNARKGLLVTCENCGAMLYHED